MQTRHHPLLALLIVASALSGCDKRYDDLTEKFPYTDSRRQEITVGRISFVSPQVPGLFHVGAKMLGVQISQSDVTIRPPMALRLVVSSTTIPASQVASCSMACFGPGEADTELIVPNASIMIGFENAEKLTDWCWSNKIPIASRADRNKWEYEKQPFPIQGQFFTQFASQSAYNQRLDETCHKGN